MSKRLAIRLVNEEIMEKIIEQAEKRNISRARLVEEILASHFDLKAGKPEWYFSKLSRSECQDAQKAATVSRSDNKANIGSPEAPFFQPKETS